MPVGSVPTLLNPACCSNALLRGSMEPADCTSLRQVETCALHKARAGFSPRPDAEAGGWGGGDLCLESLFLSPSRMAKLSGVCGHCHKNCSNNCTFVGSSAHLHVVSALGLL